MALQLTANYSDHLLEAYEVLAALYESESRVLLANYKISKMAGGRE